MSEWRHNGFVQDSDDEEGESQLEVQASRPDCGPVERVDRGHGKVEDGGNDEETENELQEAEISILRNRKISNLPKMVTTFEQQLQQQPSCSDTPRSPTTSPLTPLSPIEIQLEPPESPDPLQSSPTRKPRRIISSQRAPPLSSFRSQTTPPSRQPHDAAATVSSQILGEACSMLPSSIPHPRPGSGKGDALVEFGIEPLSDASNDDTLSDPPTDLESPEHSVLEHQPHRRTAVQVVIPTTIALQKELAEQQFTREFRQRKPIQLHPYALEGELYRREVQSRGLRPVARARSPEQRTNLDAVESQEKEFDPNKSPSSSPPEPEITVSTSELRKPRFDQAIHRTTKHLAGESSRRRPSATQHRGEPVGKKRRLGLSSMQVAHTPIGSPENRAARFDIWSIPPNSPPYSSSPLLGAIPASTTRIDPDLRTPVPNLPTPATSSGFQDVLQPLSGSEAEDVPRSTRRASGELRNPPRIAISDDSVSSDASSEAEHSDNDVRKVSKKIKGVLPASWLRLDRQAQSHRRNQEQERQMQRLQTTMSPEPQEPQRGVAHRVAKRRDERPRWNLATSPLDDLKVISDESDVDVHALYSHNQNGALNRSADGATDIAAALDARYANDDLSDMENDRLHLFTAGVGLKRKKQSRLTDTFHKTKKHKSSLAKPTKKHRTRPPALSVVDIDLSPSTKRSSVPLFIRLAQRQAILRPDLARQTHNSKKIHLQTSGDTEDANQLLQRWRKGGVKRKANVQPRRYDVSREPLATRADNQQAAPRSTHRARGAERSLLAQPTTAGLQLFKKTFPNTLQLSSKQSKRHTVFERRAQYAPSLIRQGQLETSEDTSGHTLRTTAFETSLRHVGPDLIPSLPSEQPFMNAQLARFLADDVSVMDVPATDNALDYREQMPIQKETRKRLRRKAPPTRLDVEAREYRQPSEPPVQQVLESITMKTTSDLHGSTLTGPILQGLGPFGTTYPTTFDVLPLQPDTYFHASTFIGSEDFQRALSIGDPDSRDMDERAGFCTVTCQGVEIRCGPWNDETSVGLQSIATNIVEAQVHHYMDLGRAPQQSQPADTDVSSLLRALINYTSNHLSFLDPIDRKSFVANIQHIVSALFDHLSTQISLSGVAAQVWRNALVSIAYLLVLNFQASRIAQATCIDPAITTEGSKLTHAMAKIVIATVLERGTTEVSRFLDRNKQHLVREAGIQDSEVLVESVVICMHVLERDARINTSFWDIATRELALGIPNATQVQALEASWATLFTFLPFIEVDASGMPTRSRRESFAHDNWQLISSILKRIAELYNATTRQHSASLNDYIRSNLARCHRLIKFWHWRRPELMLNVALDFCGKMSLKPLRRETNSGSFHFPHDQMTEQSLTLHPNESYFHIILKCLALGLQGMASACSEKKIRSFVFRTIPNHGRMYPKEQSLDEENLAALRNHHDLLCMLYRVAPTACRPRLDLVRGLVNHETSHREACKVNVRAWANLAIFQLAADESYETAKPFASWFQNIIDSTLRQYRLAKIEADDYIKSGAMDGTSEIARAMVQQTIKRNQEQAITILRDCIGGARNALRHARNRSAALSFLADCDLVHLLELPHFEDHRLVHVIRDTLALLNEFIGTYKSMATSKESQGSNEESQDYGDFPDLDDMDDFGIASAQQSHHENSLEFLQTSLWRLLSNAFGAETMPDDNLLMDCVDAWVSIATHQVTNRVRSWSYYLDSYQQVSWQQLRQTEQTSKFHPYFVARLIDCNDSAFRDHPHDVVGVLLVSLADRDSMLRFQHRLLHTLVQVKGVHPLLNNLPFHCDRQTGKWDINADTLRSRRSALISSILCNIRDEFQYAEVDGSARRSELKSAYSVMLRDFMNRMKSNYQTLQQQYIGTGTYVDFVQKVVQFLTQYTSDIQPVLPYFTDSVAFPLPASDPTYVVGRLCGYATKANEPRTGKQLSMFIQTIAQQAAADNQQSYLLHQITTALCPSQTPSSDRASLRSVLLQSVFPAHLTSAFSSRTGYLIARPIMQSLRPILETTTYDLRCNDPASVTDIVGSIAAITHAFIRGAEHVKGDLAMFERGYVLSSISCMLEVTTAAFKLLEYIYDRTIGGNTFDDLPLIRYIEELSTYCHDMAAGKQSFILPSYVGDALSSTSSERADLLAFSERGIQDSLKNHWVESADGQISFGPGRAKREVLSDIGTVEEERNNLEVAIASFREMMLVLRGDRNNDLKHFSADEVFV